MKSLKSLTAVVLAFLFFESFADAQTASDRIVVMISVDGLAAHYFDDPEAEMPNIRALAAAGARAKSMKSVAPTVTWPNHTTLVTGVTPAIHGVLGNNYFDRATRKKVTLIADPVYDKDEIVKVPTIYDLAKAEGMTTAAIRWPATRNAKTLDWTMPDMKWGPTIRKYSTPSLLEECARLDMVISDNNTDKESNDEISTQIFNYILEQHRPRLALFHLIDVDHTQHAKGPRTAAAYAAIKAADERVGRVWRTLEKNFPGKATLLVVSDHGFSPINKIILPNVVLRQSGLLDEKSKNNPVQIVVQGGAAFVYILDESRRDELAKKISHAIGAIEQIASIVDTEHLKDYGIANPKDDPRAPDMVLFAKMGYVFGDTSSGEIPFEEKPERKGSHGHDQNFPELLATFVAWGNGIKPGVILGDIENTQVAPTVARLLGFSMPSHGTSAPLTEILAK